jgi:sec-independent protein translocase protein TatA
MGIPSGMELFVVVAVIVLLFGGKKIPELASGIGKGIRNFKKAVNEDEPEIATTSKETIEAKPEEKIEAKTEEKTTVA